MAPYYFPLNQRRSIESDIELDPMTSVKRVCIVLYFVICFSAAATIMLIALLTKQYYANRYDGREREDKKTKDVYDTISNRCEKYYEKLSTSEPVKFHKKILRRWSTTNALLRKNNFMFERMEVKPRFSHFDKIEEVGNFSKKICDNLEQVDDLCFKTEDASYQYWKKRDLPEDDDENNNYDDLFEICAAKQKPSNIIADILYHNHPSYL
uniref:DUF4817 domain-containing protein n=1 Tax=Rhabditophanes sp. KR3021 TaxID=114890 RepID=A0AC35U9K6_9BILA